MRKLIDRFLNKPEPVEEVQGPTIEETTPSDEDTRIAELSSLSNRVRDVDGGQVFEMGEGVSMDKIAPIIGDMPWAALTDRGDYLVAMPGPIAMATLLMSVNHDSALCQEVNSLMEACIELRKHVEGRTTFAVLVDEVHQIYTISGHSSHGQGSFGFREPPNGMNSMVYGTLSRRQVAELAVTVMDAERSRPSFSSKGLDQLFKVVHTYWSDLLTQIGPEAVMETMGSNYEGKA